MTVQPARGGTTGTVYIKLPIPTVTSTTCNSKAVPGVSTKKAVPGQTATVFILQPNDKPPCRPPVGLAVPAAAPLAIEVQANSASTTEDAIATTQPTLSSDVSTSTGVAEVAPESVVDPVPSPKPVEFYGNGTSPIG